MLVKNSKLKIMSVMGHIPVACEDADSAADAVEMAFELIVAVLRRNHHNDFQYRMLEQMVVNKHHELGTVVSVAVRPAAADDLYTTMRSIYVVHWNMSRSVHAAMVN